MSEGEHDKDIDCLKLYCAWIRKQQDFDEGSGLLVRAINNLISKVGTYRKRLADALSARDEALKELADTADELENHRSQIQWMKDDGHCGTCGQRVEVFSADEGTASLIGLDARDLDQLRAEVAAMREALEWYGDEEARWRKEEEFAHGAEMASRYDEERGESVAVEIRPGQPLGSRWVPRASLQADRGRRAREALARESGK